ncbi:MAG: hypothetical protein V1870_02780 [Candidatus Aenigmatarchaeota archaeon]
MKRLVVIGGTGLGSDIYQGGEDYPVSAQYVGKNGCVSRIYVAKLYADVNMLYVNRHDVLIDDNRFDDPGNIDFETLMIGLYQDGVKKIIDYSIITTSSVGITKGGPGVIGVPYDFKDRLNYSPSVEIPGFKSGFSPMDNAFNGDIRKLIVSSAKKHVRVIDGGIYIRRVKGRRFETPAEVAEEIRLEPNKLLYLGMSSPEEAILARYLNLPYATIITSTNLAAGLGEEISHEKNVKEFETTLPRVKRLIRLVNKKFNQ